MRTNFVFHHPDSGIDVVFDARVGGGYQISIDSEIEDAPPSTPVPLEDPATRRFALALQKAGYVLVREEGETAEDMPGILTDPAPDAMVDG